MSFSTESPLLHQAEAKQKPQNHLSLSILLEYAITDVSVHPSTSHGFYIPSLPVVKGVCSANKKALQAINEVSLRKDLYVLLSSVI